MIPVHPIPTLGALALAALPLALCVAAAPPVSAAGGEASSAVTGSIAGIALSQVGVGDTPAATSFRGVDCDPYSTLVGAQFPNADGCGRDAHFGIADQNEAWCSDFDCVLPGGVEPGGVLAGAKATGAAPGDGRRAPLTGQ